MNEYRIIVVGTTFDYIAKLSEQHPGRAVYLTDSGENDALADVMEIKEEEVIFSDLANYEKASQTLIDHQKRHNYRPIGVVCYDCESMLLTSRIARHYGLDYPSEEAVLNSRNKFLSKQIWEANKVGCPRTKLIRTIDDGLRFYEEINHPVVLKPLTGSGSELVYLCETKLDCLRAAKRMVSTLAAHSNARMYTSLPQENEILNPRQVLLAEEYIKGREYSCDFIIEDRKVKIIRIARKYPVNGELLGTIRAYNLPATLPGGISEKALEKMLLKGALSLGIKRAMVMVDFLIKNDIIFLLEMTPRPAGDCLPDLIYNSCGFDILGAAFDFACGAKLTIPERVEWRNLVGLKLLADKEGVITHLDNSAILNDNRVIKCEMIAKRGKRIILPPDDYDSRILGYVIFKPDNSRLIETECIDIADKLEIELEAINWTMVH